jgi:hypothetical protein
MKNFNQSHLFKFLIGASLAASTVLGSTSAMADDMQSGGVIGGGYQNRKAEGESTGSVDLRLDAASLSSSKGTPGADMSHIVGSVDVPVSGPAKVGAQLDIKSASNFWMRKDDQGGVLPWIGLHVLDGRYETNTRGETVVTHGLLGSTTSHEQVRNTSFEWRPALSLGATALIGSCRAMAAGDLGLSLSSSTHGNNDGTAPKFGAEALAICKQLMIAADVSRTVGQHRNVDQVSVSASVKPWATQHIGFGLSGSAQGESSDGAGAFDSVGTEHTDVRGQFTVGGAI